MERKRGRVAVTELREGLSGFESILVDGGDEVNVEVSFIEEVLF